MADQNVPGLSIAIINDGAVVYDRAFGVVDIDTGAPVERDSVFEGASLSKPLFAFLTMTFVDEGRLELDEPLAARLPFDELANDPRYQRMTARHVLSHQSGLPNWRIDAPDNLLGLDFTPGDGFQYSGEGYQYLARALAAVAETDDAGLEAIFQRRVAAPFGMAQTTFMPNPAVREARATPHRDGAPLAKKGPIREFGAAYSVHSNAVDYARFVTAIMRREGLSPAAYAAFLQPQDPPIPADDPNRANGLTNWALGFSFFEYPRGAFYDHGCNNPGYTNLVAFDPAQAWGIVVFTNADQASAFLLSLVGWLAQVSSDGVDPAASVEADR